jgi:hypothetical protein
MSSEIQQSAQDVVNVPASNGWPLVAAFGLTLLFAGLVTHWLASVLGAVALVAGLFGWFREVLPHEAHNLVPVQAEPEVVIRPSRQVRRLAVGEHGNRAHLPLEIYPYRAGVIGGLYGGAAMAATAVLYGIIKHHSPWYPINLLAAAGSSEISAMSYDQLLAFNGSALLLAIFIHLLVSGLVGLLYGIALPMFPRRPVLLGGILAPLFWSGVLYSSLQIINPTLDAHIDWVWFIASQFAFGLVAGFVVSRHVRISTMQFIPFAIRAGIEAPGLMREKGSGEPES